MKSKKKNNNDSYKAQLIHSRTTLGGKSLENIFCHVNHQIWADINSLNFAQLHFRMFSSLIGFPM